MSETESEADDLWQQHLEELGDKLNAEADRTGFLRIVNRNHVFNSSNYSLSSLFSFSGSASGLNASMMIREHAIGVGRKITDFMVREASLKRPLWSANLTSWGGASTKKWASALQQGSGAGAARGISTSCRLLCSREQASDCLYERFNLMVVPSLRALQNNQEVSKLNRLNPDATDYPGGRQSQAAASRDGTMALV